jgi:hypothetical protein
MATVAHITHILAIINGVNYDNTIIGTDADFNAAWLVAMVDRTITPDQKLHVLAQIPAGYVNSLGTVTAAVTRELEPVRALYKAKNANKVIAAATTAEAGGIQQTADLTTFAYGDIASFGRVSSVDVWASLTKLHNTAWLLSRAIAGMTPAISASTANDDAPWASQTYVQLNNTTKFALRGLVTQFKAIPNAITDFNRCGYILAGIVSNKPGSWMHERGVLARNNVPSWWIAVDKHIEGLPNNAQAIAKKKKNSQMEWCSTHNQEMADAMGWG